MTVFEIVFDIILSAAAGHGWKAFFITIGLLIVAVIVIALVFAR